jgi:hypothetical protein
VYLPSGFFWTHLGALKQPEINTNFSIDFSQGFQPTICLGFNFEAQLM